MKPIYLSIVIPCYNEERNIRLGALENIAHFLTRKKYPWEVTIVDDGSSDDSVPLVKRFIHEHEHFSLMERPHQGKAAAVTSGILASRGEIVLFTDLDQATPIDQIDVMLPYFEKGNDIVIGSRNTQRRGAPILRRAMARGFIVLRNLILDLGIRDTQCGFKALKKKATLDVFSRLKVFDANRQKPYGSTVTAGFDVEVLYIAKLLGYHVAEVPVEWNYQETRHINPLKDSWESLVDLLRIRMNSMKGVYKTGPERVS